MNLVGISLAWVWLMAGVAQVVLALVGLDAQIRLYFSNAVMLLSSALAAIITLIAALGMPTASPLRRGWLLIAAGIGSWALAQAIFASYPLLNEGADTPYPSLADIPFLLTSPLLALGLLVVYGSAKLETPTWGKALALLATVLVGYWCYRANVGGMFTEGWALTAASIGYAVTDPILLGVTVYVASAFRPGTELSHSWWLLTAGVLAMLFGNQMYSYLNSIEQYQTGSAIDASWTFGYGLMALAALLTRQALR